MHLRTRIMLLFIGVVMASAALTIMHYVSQSLTIRGLETSMQALKQYVEQSEHGAFFDPEYFLLTLQNRLTELTAEFNDYRYKVYLQTVMSVVGVMVVFALGFNSLKRHIIQRLDTLRGFILDTYEHGPSHRRLELAGKDELSQVAQLINTSLNVHEAARAEFTGRILEHRKMLLTLIQQFKRPVAYFRAGGDLVVSNMDRELEDQVTQVVRQQLSSGVGMQTKVAGLKVGRGELVLQGVGEVPGAQTFIQAEIKDASSSEPANI